MRITQKDREARAVRIMRRVCEAACEADEQLHKKKLFPRSAWRKELCDAVDDYLAGEELPRNKRKGSK